MTLRRTFFAILGVLLLSAMGGPIQVIEIGDCQGVESSDGVIVIDGKCGPLFNSSVVSNNWIKVNLPLWDDGYLTKQQVRDLQVLVNGKKAAVRDGSGAIVELDNQTVDIHNGINSVHIEGVREGRSCDLDSGCGDCRQFEFRMDVTYNFLVTASASLDESTVEAVNQLPQSCISGGLSWSISPMADARVGEYEEGGLVSTSSDAIFEVFDYELPEIQARDSTSDKMVFRAEALVVPASFSMFDNSPAWDDWVHCDGDHLIASGIAYELP